MQKIRVSLTSVTGEGVGVWTEVMAGGRGALPDGSRS